MYQSYSKSKIKQILAKWSGKVCHVTEPQSSSSSYPCEYSKKGFVLQVNDSYLPRSPAEEKEVNLMSS